MTDYAGINVPQPGTSLQRLRRAWRIYTDQHGRRFGAQADVASNAPIGEFQPLIEKGFTIAPWYPTMRYATFVTLGASSSVDFEFRWDYRTLADEWSGMTAAYYEEAVKRALELPGDVPVPDVGGPVDRRIRASLGVPPRSPAIPLACELGDPWILGVVSASVNDELKALLAQQDGVNGREALEVIQARLATRAAESKVELVPSAPERVFTPLDLKPKSITDADPNTAIPAVTYGAFMHEAKTRGMSHADAAVAWKTHKENMATEVAA